MGDGVGAELLEQAAPSVIPTTRMAAPNQIFTMASNGTLQVQVTNDPGNQSNAGVGWRLGLGGHPKVRMLDSRAAWCARLEAKLEA